MRSARSAGAPEDVVAAMPPGSEDWDPLSRGQWLEMTTLLPGYILASQGDRMLMANSVEGRFPFLDRDVVDLAGALPARHKLFGLEEKYLLKRAFADLVPDEILHRPKQPYRAPDAASFFAGRAPAWFDEVTSERAVEGGGVFDPTLVAGLLEKCGARRGESMSNTDNMRVLAVVSTQLTAREVHRRRRLRPGPEPARPHCRGRPGRRRQEGDMTDHRLAPSGPRACRSTPRTETARRSRRVLTAYLAETKRRGVVVALSGGIDSSTVAALCVAALGKDRVFGLHMPERESSDETLRLSRLLAETRWASTRSLEDISPMLEAAGCYRRRDDAIRLVCPEYGPGYKSKIVLPSVVDSDSFRLYSLVVHDPDGNETRHRLTPAAYLGIVAATNFKQRVRKMLEYYHADRLNYAVAGTPNRLEYDQGFFVKLGDGAADVKPIAHLYKSQVYALAEHLGVPEEIRSRPPTTDTYSLPQSQEEFYFSLPYQLMDLCLYGGGPRRRASDEVSAATGLTAEQVDRVFRDIDQKRRTTRYLHLPPQLVEQVLPDHPGDAAEPAGGSASGFPTGSSGPSSEARTR